jgi:NADPH:quinone reductase-like Zn-dependent oxidoreductase
MSETMRRWSMDGVGRDRLGLHTVPVPEAGPGQVLVKVAAVSLNYRDKLVIETGVGLPLAFPFTPASDLCGQVVAVGAGVDRFAVGDRVISVYAPEWRDGHGLGTARDPAYRSLGGVHPGVLSEYVAFPADWFVAAPARLDAAEASTLPVAGLTAWFALVENGGVTPGSSVLVQGTGGVALFGLQIAKAQGAEVFVTSGSADKLARAKALGADHGIDRQAGDWADEALRLTEGRGIDHILEIVGGANLGRSLAAAAVHGRISVIGLLAGLEISGPVRLLMLKSVTVRGISVGHRRSLENLVRAVDHTGLTPVIAQRYPLAELPAALAHLDRGPFGKIVIELG